MSKFFNSTTLHGRANVAKATYASFAAIYVYSRLRKRSKPPPPPEGSKNDEKHDHNDYRNGNHEDHPPKEYKDHHDEPKSKGKCKCEEEESHHHHFEELRINPPNNFTYPSDNKCSATMHSDETPPAANYIVPKDVKNPSNSDNQLNSIIYSIIW